jgi:hypothetical protein
VRGKFLTLVRAYMYMYVYVCLYVSYYYCYACVYVCSFRKQIMDMSTATIEEQSEAVLEFYNVHT